MKPTAAALQHGQSIWFDYIERKMLWDGTLHRMITEEGLRGVTSNPSIFEKAMGSSADYLPAMRQAVRQGAAADDAFEMLAIEDIQWACDVFRPVHAESGFDGMVSLEVSPHLAHDAYETIEEAHRLWEAVGRDNLMIKVPGTEAGLVAVEQLLSDGINVNITLLFAVERYQQVLEAYLRAMERRRSEGLSIDRVASVASFFVSRIDTKVDKALEAAVADGRVDAQRARAWMGRTAIANAKRAYQHYLQVKESPRWQSLAADGAMPQRLLWASTSTKNPAYKDTMYVEELIGPDTVNTVPAATYTAFNDHGTLSATLQNPEPQVLEGIREAGIDLAEVAAQLENEGVTLFADAYDRLMGAVEERRRELLGSTLGRMQVHCDFEEGVARRLARMSESQVARRLWAHDGSLFGESEADHQHAEAFMGWLEVVDAMAEEAESFEELAEELVDAQIDVVVLLGMGGSSLAPFVFAQTFGAMDGAPELRVLDSTHPDQVRSLQESLEGREAVFVVASKSGSTAEVKAFDDYFYDRVAADEGEEDPGERFLAITDPDSPLERSAFDRGFRGVFHGEPEVGGRFSALSPFGLVPAAAMGVDILDLLERADLMMGSCQPSVPPSHNAGLHLGAVLAECVARGRDKLTVIASPSLASFGTWLEQLVAESTGKHDRGLIPVDGEAVGAPEVYGPDRVFFVLALDSEWETLSDRVEALRGAGHPVLQTTLADPYDVVQEMFRWEVATAILGHELGINPFDQPDVQASKDITKRLLAHLEAEGSLPRSEGLVTLVEGGAWTDAAGAEALGRPDGVEAAFLAQVDRAEAPDYVGLMAFLPQLPELEARMAELQTAVRDRRRVATTVGFGPRFLHSTGQLHKGGPNRGVFVQFVCDAEELELPGRTYGFGALCEAQALGDLLALSERERRVLRIHLGSDPQATLDRLIQACRGVGR